MTSNQDPTGTRPVLPCTCACHGDPSIHHIAACCDRCWNCGTEKAFEPYCNWCRPATPGDQETKGEPECNGCSQAIHDWAGNVPSRHIAYKGTPSTLPTHISALMGLGDAEHVIEGGDEAHHDRPRTR